MRLCERTIYLKLTTHEDLFVDARYQDVAERIGAYIGRPVTTVQDQQRKMRALPMDDGGLDVWMQPLDGGMFQHARLVLRFNDTDVPRIEIAATNHPYSGNYITMVDARIPRERVIADVDAFTELFGELLELTTPIFAHAHDTDDNGAQNAGSAMTLKLGYGIEVPDGTEIDVSESPGREMSRGEFRYCANWLTFHSADMIEKLEPFSDPDLAQPAHEDVAGGRLYRLYASPEDPAAPDKRAAQAALRDALGFRSIVDKERWRYGYWQRKR